MKFGFSPSPGQYWGVLKGRENQLLTLCLQLAREMFKKRFRKMWF